MHERGGGQGDLGARIISRCLCYICVCAQTQAQAFTEVASLGVFTMECTYGSAWFTVKSYPAYNVDRRMYVKCSHCLRGVLQGFLSPLSQESQTGLA